MSFSTFPFDYDPQPVGNHLDVDNYLDDIFSGDALGLQQLLDQHPQNESLEPLDHGILNAMQFMIHDFSHPPEQDQTPIQPLPLPDLSEHHIYSSVMPEQHPSEDPLFQHAIQGQVPQQTTHLDNPAVLHEILLHNDQLQAQVHELRSQLEVGKPESQIEERKPSLRLRMRLQPQAEKETKICAETEVGELQHQAQPEQLQPIQDHETSSHPLSDIFGGSLIPIPGPLPQGPQPRDQQVLPEQAPSKDDSISNLPFWKVENPSNIPDYDFLLSPQVAQASDPLAAIDTNIFASEITDGAREAVLENPKNARNAKLSGGKNRSDKASVYAIATPSDLTQENLSVNVGNEDVVGDQTPPRVLTRAHGTRRRHRVLSNEEEPQERRRASEAENITNSDSENDDAEEGDPDYSPGEANELPEEVADDSFDSDRPKTEKRSHLESKSMAAKAYLEQIEESSEEESEVQEFDPNQVTCGKCNDIFANSDSLDRHFRLVHSEPKTKQHICQECQQSCRSQQNLRRHWSNVHSGDLKFICDVCEARFSTKRSLSLHRTKQHPDVYKPRPKRKKNKFFECQLCDYTSDQSYNVVRHFFTKHTDKVAMECLYGCGRTFKSVSNAKVHFSKCKHRPMTRE